MPITHIEVTNGKASSYVKTGQLLAVVPERETPAFYWVKSFGGTLLKVSKKTQRVCGTENGFFRTHRQPQCSF